MSQPEPTTDRQSFAVEAAAAKLATFEGSTAFDPNIVDDLDRMNERNAFRERAKALLEYADARKVCRDIARIFDATAAGSRARRVARTAHVAALRAAKEIP